MKEANILLSETVFDKEFVLNDGRRIKSISQLSNLLNDMSDEVFFHHVTPDRNDFYNWIKDVFGDSVLAERIRNVKNKKELNKQLIKRLLEIVNSKLKRN